MLKKLKENSLLISAVIVLIMIIVVLFINPKEKVKKPQNVVDNKSIISKFDKIGNNYEIDIEETNNNVVINHIYYTDSKMELYETENMDVGYVKYNDKFYIMDGNTHKLSKTKNINFIDEQYYDLDFIKNLLSNCEFEFENNATVKCNIKRRDYFNKLNSKYNTKYGNDSEDEIEIILKYSDSIKNINIDYSSDYVINKYNLTIKNIGNNDFHEIREYYKDILE